MFYAWFKSSQKIFPAFLCIHRWFFVVTILTLLPFILSDVHGISVFRNLYIEGRWIKPIRYTWWTERISQFELSLSFCPVRVDISDLSTWVNGSDLSNPWEVAWIYWGRVEISDLSTWVDGSELSNPWPVYKLSPSSYKRGQRYYKKFMNKTL